MAFARNFADMMIGVLLKWLLLFHPVYVSLTEIKYNEKNSGLEIGIRMFTNDLEATLHKNNPSAKVDLLNTAEAEKAKTAGLIKKYIVSRFKLTVNGSPATFSYVGFENIEENTWCYFEVKNVLTLQKLHITNTILYDWQPGQLNMHVVKKGSVEKTCKLTNPDSGADFNF